MRSSAAASEASSPILQQNAGPLQCPLKSQTACWLSLTPLRIEEVRKKSNYVLNRNQQGIRAAGAASGLHILLRRPGTEWILFRGRGRRFLLPLSYQKSRGRDFLQPSHGCRGLAARAAGERGSEGLLRRTVLRPPPCPLEGGSFGEPRCRPLLARELNVCFSIVVGQPRISRVQQGVWSRGRSGGSSLTGIHPVLGERQRRKQRPRSFLGSRTSTHGTTREAVVVPHES